MYLHSSSQVRSRFLIGGNLKFKTSSIILRRACGGKTKWWHSYDPDNDNLIPIYGMPNLTPFL